MKSQISLRNSALEVSSFGASTASRVLSLAFVLGVFLASGVQVLAKEKKDLDITLKAHRVVRSASGDEQLSDSPSAKPGDVVQYTAVFHNNSAHPLDKVSPTIPVPAGMIYQPEAKLPAPSEASVDGKHFEPIPLRRTHRLADGRQVVVEVPTSAYRALQWRAGEISPGAEYVAAMRVRVLADGR